MSHRPLLLLVAGLCLVWSDCSPEKERFEQVASSVIELTYWPAPNQQEVQFADSVVRRWNRAHPSVRVRVQPIPVSQSTEEVLLAAIAAGTTPDICSNIWPGALYEYTKAGGLLALSQFADFDSIVGSRTPRELLHTFRSDDGQFHQVPWKTNPVMMFYNKRLFREAGVERVPRTYSEYLAVGSKITRDTDGDGRVDVWMGERDIRPIWWQRLFDFYPFYIAASGGQTLFHQSDVVFDNEAAIKVMAFFRECYGRKLFPLTFFQGGDPFLLERKATHFAGPWNIATIQKLAPHLEFGIAPLPVPDDYSGPVYTAGDYKNIAIFSTTRHPKEAWEFVKFMITAEHDLLLLRVANQIPVRGDLLSNELFASYFLENPAMVTFAQQAVYTRGVDSAPDLKEILDVISQEYEAAAVYGRKDPERAVHDAAARARTIIRWNQ